MFKFEIAIIIKILGNKPPSYLFANIDGFVTIYLNYNG